jgi:hypothetical protein
MGRIGFEKYLGKNKLNPSGSVVEEQLRRILKTLNVRYNLEVKLINATLSGASASPDLDLIEFDFDGKYTKSIKLAVSVFGHEYAHILLKKRNIMDYEEYCDIFGDLLVREFEVELRKK